MSLLKARFSCDRRFAAYALASCGREAAGTAPDLKAIVDASNDPFASDSLAAALALEKVGEPGMAAQAFSVILKRRGLEVPTREDEIDPWDELRRLLAEARRGLAPDIEARLMP